MFCENLTCARATLSSLCACRIALVLARCSFWNRLRNPLVTLGLSFWNRSRNPLVTLGLQIALVVAPCSFWNRLCHPLVALGVSDRSRCGTVLILRWLAQPSRHFGRVRSLSLRRGAHVDGQGDLGKRSWQGDFIESLRRDLVQRALFEILYGDLAKRSLKSLA